MQFKVGQVEILKNETDIDITHKLNNFELSVWMKHLKRLQQEIELLNKMWALDVDGELEDQLILQQLQESSKENKTLLESLKCYSAYKASALLCEDFQCELDIIAEHEKHRNTYLHYLNSYRKLKNEIYRRLKGKPAPLSNRDIKYI